MNNNNTPSESVLCFSYEKSFRQENLLILFICTSMMTIFSIITSSMLIYGLIKTNKVLSMTTKLFIYLSICDIVIGFVVLPNQLVSMRLQLPCTMIVTRAFINIIGINFSMFIILTLTVLRYLSINNPLQKVQDRKVYIALFVELALLPGFSFIYVYLSYKPELSIMMGILLLFCAVYMLVFVIISVALNIILQKTLQGKQKSCVTTQSKIRMVRQKKAIDTLLTLLVVMIVCYLPGTVAVSVTAYNYLSNKTQTNLVWRHSKQWATFTIGLNSSLNSLVYILRTKRIRPFYVTISQSKCMVEHDKS